ncbi:MAG: site-specific integrase [Pseudomonadota bacterium]
MVEAFINRASEWVSFPLSKINSAHFSRYRDQRLQTLKPASVCRELGLIQHAYDIASREWDIPIQINPVAKIKKPVINNRRERRLNGGDLLSLFKGVKGCQNSYMRPLVLFAILTAMRRGEILALEWRFVNLEGRTLHIPMSKNGHSRTIPLSGKALRILRYLKGQSGKEMPSHVFPLTENTIKMAWQRMIRRSGIEDLHFHDLRHEAVSRFFERGLSVPEVALISGHRDFRIISRYTHLKPEAIAEKLN